eukprot:CAMPEP_0115246616 /NCGR_PEP_ID=MMETSP0270-20121206/41120_1 /TAXON_ID=71861 /ORGANISM="Scrippsiella trochoidea, Strain CCMP3099" /LENGTH=140 /DNA_ID=CAMNT_0002661839 /DNA_START=316 /DNA_END=735 /DNA_ORIENTATION=-
MLLALQVLHVHASCLDGLDPSVQSATHALMHVEVPMHHEINDHQLLRLQRCFAWIDVGSKSGRKQDATMASASGLGLACLMSNLCWSLRGRLCAVSKCFKAWDHSYLGNNCNMADCRPAVSLLPALLTKSLQGQLSMHVW